MDKTEENSNILTLHPQAAKEPTAIEDKKIIYEVQTYIDDEGRTVISKTSVYGTNPTTIFQGSFSVGTNVGPVRLSFEFPEGTTLEQCFSTFDDFAKMTIQKAQEEASSRIVTPTQAAKGDILIP